MGRRAASAVLLMVAVAAGCAAHRASPSSPQTILVAPGAFGAGMQHEVAGYWTDDRMRRAEQADDLAAFRASQRAQAVAQSGAGRSGAGRSGAGRSGAGWSGARRPTAVAPPVAQAARWPVGGLVDRAVGRVFFTLRGRDYVCTGTAVASRNRDTVVTAGHCVNAGPGPYVRNWVFVPGYRNGSRPYGTWVARRLLAPAAWVRTGDTPNDVGFAELSPRAGRHLVDVVGGMSIAFDQPAGRYVYAFGYPVGAPSLGRYVLYCRGVVRRDPYGTPARGLRCSMAGGSSGGPWLVGLSGRTGAGTIYAVTSFSYRGMPGVIWAAALGRGAAAVYRIAQVG